MLNIHLYQWAFSINLSNPKIFPNNNLPHQQTPSKHHFLLIRKWLKEASHPVMRFPFLHEWIIRLPSKWSSIVSAKLRDMKITGFGACRWHHPKGNNGAQSDGRWCSPCWRSWHNNGRCLRPSLPSHVDHIHTGGLPRHLGEDCQVGKTKPDVDLASHRILPRLSLCTSFTNNESSVHSYPVLQQQLVGIYISKFESQWLHLT